MPTKIRRAMLMSAHAYSGPNFHIRAADLAAAPGDCLIVRRGTRRSKAWGILSDLPYKTKRNGSGTGRYSLTNRVLGRGIGAVLNVRVGSGRQSVLAGFAAPSVPFAASRARQRLHRGCGRSSGWGCSRCRRLRTARRDAGFSRSLKVLRTLSQPRGLGSGYKEVAVAV